MPIDSSLDVDLGLQQALGAVAVAILAQLVHWVSSRAWLGRITSGFVDLRDELVFDGVEIANVAVSAGQEARVLSSWSLLEVGRSEHEVPASSSVPSMQWVIQLQVHLASQRLALPMESIVAEALIPCFVGSSIRGLVQYVESLG